MVFFFLFKGAIYWELGNCQAESFAFTISFTSHSSSPCELCDSKGLGVMTTPFSQTSQKWKKEVGYGLFRWRSSALNELKLRLQAYYNHRRVTNLPWVYLELRPLPGHEIFSFKTRENQANWDQETFHSLQGWNSKT